MVQRVCRVIWADGVAAFAETVRDARLDVRGFSGWQYEEKIFGVALGTRQLMIPTTGTNPSGGSGLGIPNG